MNGGRPRGLIAVGALALAACIPASLPRRDVVVIEREPERMIVRPGEAGTPVRRAIEQAVLVLLDRDADGRISRTEATALPELAQSYALLDTNRDGAIDRIELRAAMAAAFWGIANLPRTPVFSALAQPAPGDSPPTPP